MTLTLAPVVDVVFDCPQWGFDEFQAEIIGPAEVDGADYDELRAAGIAIMRDKLTAYWARQGKTAVFLEHRLYGQLVTVCATGLAVPALALMPTTEESMTAWEHVAADITADEVRQSAGLA